MPIDRDKFFAGIRQQPFDGKLTAGQAGGVTAILDEWDRRRLTDPRWLAYMLGTAKWETDHTMQPIQEAGGTAYLTRNYDVKGRNPARARLNGNVAPGDGVRYSGKGFVQLTWRNNYEKMTRLLRKSGVQVDLVARPDLATRPDVASFVMFEGMIGGAFTGKKLADYFNARTTDWINARRIINGVDKAAEIAGIAKMFYADITAAA